MHIDRGGRVFRWLVKCARGKETNIIAVGRDKRMPVFPYLNNCDEMRVEGESERWELKVAQRSLIIPIFSMKH